MNNLDIKSKNFLKEGLKRFEGTLNLVSHDRDFLQGLTNLVYEFKDHKLKEYLGDIDYYLEQRGRARLGRFAPDERRWPPVYRGQ